MTRLTFRLVFGAMGLVALTACQGAPPQEEATQEPPPENAVTEETFEGGDTGNLDPGPKEPTDEEEPTDDSQ